MTLAQYTINGLLVGGIFALVGLGFSMVWGILNIINLAHAAMIMLGAYFTWVLVQQTPLDPLLTIPIVMILLFFIGYIIQRGVLNFVMRAPLLTTFVITFGLELLVTNLGQRIWTANTKSVVVSYSGKGVVLSSAGIHFGRPGAGSNVIIPFVGLVAFAIALALTAVLFLLMERSKTGSAIRAVGMDVQAARLMGIDIAHIYALTFAIGAALAGAAGSLIAITQGFSPASFDPYNVRAFLVVVLGGLGSIPGALLGGVAFGLIDQFSQAPLPHHFFFGWSSLARAKDAIFFLVLLAVLLIKPTGLLGREGYR